MARIDSLPDSFAVGECPAEAVVGVEIDAKWIEVIGRRVGEIDRSNLRMPHDKLGRSPFEARNRVRDLLGGGVIRRREKGSGRRIAQSQEPVTVDPVQIEEVIARARLVLNPFVRHVGGGFAGKRQAARRSV